MKFELNINHILVFAVILRIICILINQFWFPLPQSGADTIAFHKMAIAIHNGWPYSFQETISDGAVLFCSFGALIYSVFGNHSLIWSFFLLPCSYFTILFVYRTILLNISNKNYALFSALILALFPSFVAVQSLILRESLIHLLLTASIYTFFYFLKFRIYYYLIVHFLLAIFASILHSGMIFIAIASIILLLFSPKLINNWTRGVIGLGAISLVILLDLTGIGLDKFGGSFSRLYEIILLGGQRLNNSATANYPHWLLMDGSIQDLLLFPIRVVAFYTAPLIPFMMRKTSHLLIIVDVIQYILLWLVIFYNRRFLFKSYHNLALLFYVFIFSAIFAYGASNFATNVRHRSKILPVLLMLPLSSLKFWLKKEDSYNINKSNET